MEFFNDLSKRFSNVAKSVTEKTKDSVEVTRIANDLRVQKNQLEQLYTDLGKACYAVRIGEGDADQAEQLAQRIQTVLARIEELSAQRDAIRDIRRCPGCGAVMTKDARFCSSCSFSWRSSLSCSYSSSFIFTSASFSRASSTILFVTWTPSSRISLVPQ